MNTEFEKDIIERILHLIQIIYILDKHDTQKSEN